MDLHDLHDSCDLHDFPDFPDLHDLHDFLYLHDRMTCTTSYSISPISNT